MRRYACAKKCFVPDCMLAYLNNSNLQSDVLLGGPQNITTPDCRLTKTETNYMQVETMHSQVLQNHFKYLIFQYTCRVFVCKLVKNPLFCITYMYYIHGNDHYISMIKLNKTATGTSCKSCYLLPCTFCQLLLLGQKNIDLGKVDWLIYSPPYPHPINSPPPPSLTPTSVKYILLNLKVT